MSVRINVDGVDQVIERMRGVLDSLGGKNSGKAIAKALNQSLAQGRKQAAREARKAYTAPIKKLFDDIRIRRARPGNPCGELEMTGGRGVSLIHFKAQPNTPATHPREGVTAQTKRGGPRHPWRSENGGSKAFIMKKKQGGFGVFVRHKKLDSDGEEKDAFEMLFGPSPIQALQRGDVQEKVSAAIEEAFAPMLNQEIDRLLSASFGR